MEDEEYLGDSSQEDDVDGNKDSEELDKCSGEESKEVPTEDATIESSANCPDIKEEIQQQPSCSQSATADVVFQPGPEDHVTLTDDAEDVLPEMMEDWSGIKPVRSRTAGSASSLSTIHPDVVKQRVKSAINRKEKTQVMQRIRAKGEASAATRKKRENKDLIRADGIWGWDN